MSHANRQQRYASSVSVPARPRRAGQLPPGRHGLTPEEVARSQRERILGALTELVGERGYDAVTVTDVIKRAGVARNTFYVFFGDRKDALVAAYEERFDNLLALTLEAFNAHDLWEDRLRAALQALLGALAANPAAGRLCFVDILAGGPTAVERRNDTVQGLAAIFDAGRAEAKRELPELTGLSIVGGLSEILYREIAAGNAASLPELLPQLVYMTAVPFVGPEGAARAAAQPASA